jgi:hypothetical protein
MIEVDLQTGFIIYIFAWFITLGILWAREIWRFKAFDWALTKDRLCKCDACHYSFLIKDRSNISRCPRCNEMCILRKASHRY